VLKDWIQKGRYAPNERLPSEGELCEMLDVSRITTRRAIEMLTQDGLIRRVQGLGTFVSPTIPKAAEPQGSMSDLATRVRRLSERTTLADIEIGRVKADATTATELKLRAGDEVIRAAYTRIEKKVPIGCAELFVPAALGVEITEHDLRENASPTLLRTKGIELSGAHQLIGATLADGQLASRLKINVGSPLIRIRLLILGPEREPVEHLRAHYRADVYEHHAFLSSL
jgi:GntR family transcriptional regulator